MVDLRSSHHFPLQCILFKKYLEEHGFKLWLRLRAVAGVAIPVIALVTMRITAVTVAVVVIAVIALVTMRIAAVAGVNFCR